MESAKTLYLNWPLPISCPKCGYGVDSCYGCKLVERDSEIAALKAKLAAVCEAGKAVLNEYDQDCPHCCDYKTPPHADQCEIGQLGHALAAEALIPASKWEVKG